MDRKEQTLEFSWRWILPVQEPAIKEPAFRGFGEPGPESSELENVKRLRPSQYLQKEFCIRKEVGISKAMLYATAHGLYRVWVNGVRIDDRVMAPEVTAFDKELTWQQYDVSHLLQEGENVISVILTDGWHVGRIGLVGDSCQYADKVAFLCQLNLDYADGKRETVVSDKSWHCATGALVYSDIYIGERYDARKEPEGWGKAGKLPGIWQPVEEIAFGEDGFREKLVPQSILPVRKKEHLIGKALITPKGELVYDFGQVIAGVERIMISAPSGTVWKLEHSEVLDKDGNFIRNIGGANKNQTDFYVCRGKSAENSLWDVEIEQDTPGDIAESEKMEWYEPIGTWHGFRYLKVSVATDESETEFVSPTQQTEIETDASQVILYRAEAWAIRTDNKETASFSCTDERLNQLWHNIVWSLRGNTISIPTDCPQRERSGFTGDMQVIVNTASWLMDIRQFAASWLHTVRLEQNELGEVTIIAPNFPSLEAMQRAAQPDGSRGANTSCGWGDAIAIVPWELYQFYGDLSYLKENYEAMKKWLLFVKRWAWTGIYPDVAATTQEWLSKPRDGHTRYLWNTGFSFGDWLVPSRSKGMSNPFATAEETKGPIGTAYYANTADLVANTAEVLGYVAEAQEYRALAAQIRQAYQKEYYLGDGWLSCGMKETHLQGIYVTALAFHMLPKSEEAACSKRLAELIAEQEDCLDTGFLSVKYLMDVLCDNDRKDLAIKLLFQTKCPSWLYEVEKGATTIWESWSAILPDGTVTTSSYNHYSFGCVADWMMRHLAGIQSREPGFRRVEIAPLYECGLSQVSASFVSACGKIMVEWERKEKQFQVAVWIPEGMQATAVLPDGSQVELESGKRNVFFR